MAGVSNFDVPLLERCESVLHVDSLQPPFSLVQRDVAAREIPWCAQHGTGVICYSPMESGLLTDNFTAAKVAKLASDDWRRRAPQFQEPNLSRNLALRDALRPIAKRHGSTVAALAVAWVIAWPGVTGAIVGARSPEQVDGWIGAAGGGDCAGDRAHARRQRPEPTAVTTCCLIRCGSKRRGRAGTSDKLTPSCCGSPPVRKRQQSSH
jgi:aryl-alcohol dehydrogenase-like predicted oxidoreductase